MDISGYIDLLAQASARDPREVELYARRLREAGLLPKRPGGRKLSITTEQAANLMLALVTGDNARQAPDALRHIGVLRRIDRAPRPFGAAPSLISFLIHILEFACANKKAAEFAERGTLVIMRRPPAALFRAADRAIEFRSSERLAEPAQFRKPDIDVMSEISGHFLVEVSRALAGKEGP